MEWTVPPAAKGKTLSAWLRETVEGTPWSTVKDWIGSGKVFVGGTRVTDVARRLRGGERVEVKMSAPRTREGFEVLIKFEDPHVIVIEKPAGVSSVPYEKQETGTAMDLIREAWRRMGRPATAQAIFVVHRIDKDTSGLLAFAKTKAAERGLQAQLRSHDMARTYLCVAHGKVVADRIESLLVPDRGDGIRGSARRRDDPQGKRAVTHVEPVKTLAGGRATLCRVRLETGKTHQIRIHLSERGHPLVGETVYIRDQRAKGLIPELKSPRLLLHAETLGFAHPMTGEWIELKSEPPADFMSAMAGLG